MKELFKISKIYSEISKSIESYCLTKVPFLILGNNGSKKEDLIKSSLYNLNLEYIEVNCNLQWSRENFSKKWEEFCNKKLILLINVNSLKQDIQLYINNDLLKKKESNEFPCIISTAYSELREDVKRKLFREDLYYRLGVVTYEIPPLFQRKNEILPIAQYLLEYNSKKYSKRLKYFDENLIEFLMKFNFPGDLDQLESLIEILVIAGRGRTLKFKNIPTTIFKNSNLHSDRVIPIIPGVTLKDYEKEIIKENLKLNDGNREKTAKILNMSLRTLYRKLEEYRIKEIISP